jgi:hypothetical protein
MAKLQKSSINQNAGIIILSQISKDIRNSAFCQIDPLSKSLRLNINSQECSYEYKNNKIAKVRSSTTQYLCEENQFTSLSFAKNNRLVFIKLDQLDLAVCLRN